MYLLVYSQVNLLCTNKDYFYYYHDDVDIWGEIYSIYQLSVGSWKVHDKHESDANVSMSCSEYEHLPVGSASILWEICK